jgi:ubiquinone/menaquinone biosynthesis C-methylase UbiE
MEKMDFEANSFDAVISNGAFCLAPSKEAAFGEIFRVLKPGGRCSICTSVIKKALGPTVKWPLCMRMFIHKGQLISKCPFGFFKSPKKPTKFL